MNSRAGQLFLGELLREEGYSGRAARGAAVPRQEGARSRRDLGDTISRRDLGAITDTTRGTTPQAQYLLYKHCLLHGLNVSAAIDGLTLGNDAQFRMYWLCLNTSYVFEFFLQVWCHV